MKIFNSIFGWIAGIVSLLSAAFALGGWAKGKDEEIEKEKEQKAEQKAVLEKRIEVLKVAHNETEKASNLSSVELASKLRKWTRNGESD